MINLRYLNIAATFLLLFLIVYILFIGKALILPLVIALVFWYIIIRLAALYQRIQINHWHIPYGLALVIALITGGMVLYLFFVILSYSISNIISAAPLYQQKLQQILDYANHLISGKLNINQLISEVNLTHLFSKLALLVSTTASNFVLILIYMLFLFLEHRTFNTKLKAMCNSDHQYRKVNSLINRIGNDINSYLKIKTGVNLIAGFASFIVLLGFGITYAEFWGVLFFIVHYIPYVGPIAGIILVLLAASIQIVHLLPFIILAILLAIIQFGTGNFLEPRWLGTRLNLSPFVILISLAFWASIWGILGMILCVPIMVIINIILAKFPKTRPVAVMLSADGQVETE